MNQQYATQGFASANQVANLSGANYGNGVDASKEPISISSAIQNLSEKALCLDSIARALSDICDFLHGASPICSEKANTPPLPCTPVGQLNLAANFITEKTNLIQYSIASINKALGR